MMLANGDDDGTVNCTGLVTTANIDVMTSDLQPNKCRRKKSIVWDNFTTEIVSADCTRAICKKCQKSFAYITGKKQSGTSHLKRHILGICPADRARNELSASQNGIVRAPSKKRYRASPGSVTVALDQERYVSEIARMIILHEYPVSMVEDPGFIGFARLLQPHLSMVSFDAVQNKIVTMYTRMKNSLVNTLAEIPSRVSLSIDLWTSDHTVGYAILTGSFIDVDWKFHCRVLKFVLVPFPKSQVAFNDAVISCLSEWGLTSKLFALSIDMSCAEKSVTENLSSLLSKTCQYMPNGRTIISNCYARAINRMAIEALCASKEAVTKVRDCVKYIKAMDLSQQLKVPLGQSLVIDNPQMWDSTYYMLSTACEVKEVFSRLETDGPDYKQAPSVDDWMCIEVLCTYLKLFLDASAILTTENYPTADTFFLEAYTVLRKLAFGSLDKDPFISHFAKPLYDMFYRYWKDCYVDLTMAVVMDPRYKLRLVEHCFLKIFGNDFNTAFNAVMKRIYDLYFEYMALNIQLVDFSIDNGQSGLDIYISTIDTSIASNKELDQYLEESLLPRDKPEFNILEWWKLNQTKYPNLSHMAADLLSIPFATISGNSVFSTASQKLDCQMSSLKHDTLEALICAKNWLQHGVQEQDSNTSLSDISRVGLKMETQ
ncbi:zinc finger BED domain-containing protein DAYSLEEPER-like [Amaranthus tricolor]|uniref:zinc finger BED domain-containing protein DAYSLEEPER-like n=1 Tax=Amaranthus tricolor TaxID=29722 RepID=UPI00258C69DB|nr:zinc finger BED domain-containing protein DAYSLEEPER-like [Amaranthus tricolor]